MFIFSGKEEAKEQGRQHPHLTSSFEEDKSPKDRLVGCNHKCRNKEKLVPLAKWRKRKKGAGCDVVEDGPWGNACKKTLNIFSDNSSCKFQIILASYRHLEERKMMFVFLDKDTRKKLSATENKFLKRALFII